LAERECLLLRAMEEPAQEDQYKNSARIGLFITRYEGYFKTVAWEKKNGVRKERGKRR